MRLAKIKNSYLFKSDKPHGSHTYAIYYDKKNKENRAVALTHLYIKDEKRFKQVRKGNIRIEKFKEFDAPSGVQNYFYSRNTKNNKINLNDKSSVRLISKRYLSKNQSNRIKAFARNDYNKK